MKDNKLIIAAAGAGKTTFLVKDAFGRKERILITTFTIENEGEIRNKFIQLYGYVPEHVTIQTWFSFLLQHGVKPYQGSCHPDMFCKTIKGVFLSDGMSAVYKHITIAGKKIPIQYKEDEEFIKHYFSTELKIYTDKIAKFVIRANKKTKGGVVDRISRIFPTIYIDEVQDLSGYDLDFLKLLFAGNSNVVCVGDPRQVTYYTHWERKNEQYRNGRIKQFVIDKCIPRGQISIDEQSLSSSHRNNKPICDFSSSIYPLLPETIPCNCKECHPLEIEHQGVFIVKESKVRDYLACYNPVQLRWDAKIVVMPGYSCYNFGGSKGKTFDRVLIYPTGAIKAWLANHEVVLENVTRAKFYVAVTRARYSVAFVIPDNEVDRIGGVEVWG